MKTFFRTVLIFISLFPCTVFAQWSAPINISPKAMNASMNENMGPCMASSHDTLHVIWSDHRTHGYAIYYTRSIDSGKTWTVPVNITDTNGHATMPSLAVCGRNVHVVWWDSIVGNPCSRYMHSVDGGNTWGIKKFIDSNTCYWPGVAVSGSTVLVSIDKRPLSRTTVFLTKSVDNGATFAPEQQISTPTAGVGRSEDQGTSTDGKYIHMCWNDNRNNPTELQIYYRRSKDMGVTWDPEIAVSDSSSYSPMVYVNNAQVNVLFGFGSIVNTWISQSADSGSTWVPNEKITTNNTNGVYDAYPSMVCDGQNLYMTTHRFPSGPWGVWYTQSSNGGATWASQVQLGTCNGTSYIALTCPEVHVVWPNNGAIYYSKNPTAAPSCPINTTGISTIEETRNAISIYPNPASNNTTISFGEAGVHQVEIYDIAGRKVSGFTSTNKEYTFSCAGLSPGIYFVKSISEKGNQIVKLIKQ